MLLNPNKYIILKTIKGHLKKYDTPYIAALIEKTYVQMFQNNTNRVDTS